MIPRVGSRAQRSVPNPPQVESKIVERSRCVRANCNWEEWKVRARRSRSLRIFGCYL